MFRYIICLAIFGIWATGANDLDLNLGQPTHIEQTFSEQMSVGKTAWDVRTGLSLARADVDRNGVADLVAGYASGEKGFLMLYRGNPPFSLKQDDATFQEQEFLTELPVIPDYLFAVDVDGDGGEDLIVAAQDDVRMYLLPGDAKGNFGDPKVWELDGPLQTILAADLMKKDHIDDVAVVTAQEDGARLHIFRGARSGLAQMPQQLDLPSPQAAITYGDADGDSFKELLVASGQELFIFPGKRTDLDLSRPWIQSLEVPAAQMHFNHRGTKAGPHLHLLSVDGRLQTTALSVPKPGVPMKAPLSWQEWDRFEESATRAPMVVAHTVTRTGKAVSLIDQKRLHLYAPEGNETLSLDLPTEARAALSMRMNGDALYDLVILDKTGELWTMRSKAAASYMVTTTADERDDICDAHCSLYDALITAEASLGLDTISFAGLAAGDNAFFIADDLPDLLDPINLDGTTHPDGLISITMGTLSFHGGSNTVRGLQTSNSGNLYGIISFLDNGDNVFQGNMVHLNSTEETHRGVLSEDCDNNLIGGTGSGEGNVFTHPDLNVLTRRGSFTVIQGNTFGLAPDGTTLVPSSRGLAIGDADVLVGGVEAGARNVFANSTYGASIGSGSILGNYFGTDITGTIPLTTGASSSFSVTQNSEIGGAHAHAGNLDYGTDQGMRVRGVGNIIQGNMVGTLGTEDPNLASCFSLDFQEAGSNILGGHGIGEANILRGRQAGINPTGEEGTVDWSGNSFGNHSVAAILDTCNNHNINNCYQPPIIRASIDAADTLSVWVGMIDYSNSPVTIHFYKDDGTPIPAGQEDLGQDIYTGSPKTTTLGNATNLGIAIGDQIVAMATDSEGKTSFFSEIATVGPPEDYIITVTNAADTDDGTCDGDCTLREAINEINGNPDSFRIIEFDLPGTAPFEIIPTSALPQILAPVDIDGTSQPGFAGSPVVHLRGHQAGGSSAGLVMRGEFSRIRGLAVSEFAAVGIYVWGDHSYVEGNYVGTDTTGTVALGNGVGIWARKNRAIIGGLDSEARNIVSGNTTGIHIVGDYVTVLGNYVGTDVTGTIALGNATGIVCQPFTFTYIGAREPGGGNLISGNTGIGIDLQSRNLILLGNKIGTDITGNFALGNHTGISHLNIGTRLEVGDGTEAGRNLISGNVLGIRSSVFMPHLLHNYIGTNQAGDAAIPNTTGLHMERCTIEAPFTDNVISGNGVGIYCDDCEIESFEGNYIGTNAAGNAAVGNDIGLHIRRSHRPILFSDSINLISGNTTYGVLVESTTNFILENALVGTDITGSFAIPNGNGLQVGGTATRLSNSTISGNLGDGIIFTRWSNFLVENSQIGTDRTGSFALPNHLNGIVIRGGSGNIQNNVISGNLFSGIRQEGGVNLRINGNFVGTTPTNDALGNGEHGLYIVDADGTLVGDTIKNVFAHNDGDGIQIFSGVENRLMGFETYNNGGMGIDLGGDGVSLNDPGDGDAGANATQNYPVIESFSSSGGTIDVVGSLNSTPSQVFTLDFFRSTGDTSGHGEGDAYLGQLTGVTTDANGDATFNVTFAGSLDAEESIAAIATDADGNSSEFSRGFGGEIFSDGFESGNLSAWSLEPDPLAPNGSLEVRLDAAIEEYFGLRVTMGAGNPTMVRDDTPAGSEYYRARFYLRTDGLVLPEGESFDIFAGYDSSDDILFRAALTGTASGHQLDVLVLDNGNWSVPLSQVLSNGYHYLELGWDPGNGASNLQVIIDGINYGGLAAQSTGGGLVHTARWGLVDGLDSGTSGYLDLDSFVSKEISLEIGPMACPANPSWAQLVPAWPSETVLNLIPSTVSGCD